MAQPKALVVLRVENQGGQVFAKVRDDYGNVREQSLLTLNRGTLMRCQANVGVLADRFQTDGQRIASIRDKVLAPDYVPRDFVPTRKADRKPAPVDEPKQPLIPEGPVQPQIDRAMLAEMVAEIVIELDLDQGPRPIIVNLPSGQTTQIDGHTHAVFPEVLMILNAKLHVFLVGPAGTGKSTIGEQCAHALGLPFRQLSLAPDTGTHEIMGFMGAQGQYVRTGARDCYEHGGVFVLDEIDNGNEGVLAGMNSMLSNSELTFPDGPVKRHPDFRVVATGNTAGTGATTQFIGRNVLDFATLSRFEMVHVPIDETLERAIALSTGCPVETVTSVLTTVRTWRTTADAHKLYGTDFGPRRIRSVCALVAGGMTLARAYDVAIWKGTDQGQRDRITRA